MPRPQPLVSIVNGKEMSEIRLIPPEDIENVEMLPADETIAPRPAGCTRRDAHYAAPRPAVASFPPRTPPFGSYIARQVAG